MPDLHTFAGRSAAVHDVDKTDVVDDVVKVAVVVFAAVATNPQHIGDFVRYLTAVGLGTHHLPLLAASYLSFD